MLVRYGKVAFLFWERASSRQPRVLYLLFISPALRYVHETAMPKRLLQVACLQSYEY
jgi:hypothetical protein